MSGFWFTRLALVYLGIALVALLISSPANAQCAPFPRVKLWGDISHQKITRYVERNLAGDWEAYIYQLQLIKNQLQATFDQKKSVKIRFKDQRYTLTGATLHKYLTLSEKRIEIIRCLSGLAPGKRTKAKKPTARKAGGGNKVMSTTHVKRVRNPGNASIGLGLSVLCADCHGESGSNDDPLTPNLAGQNRAYLIKQVKSTRNTARDRGGYDTFTDRQRRETEKQFRSLIRHKRSVEFMDDAVAGLSDKQIYDLAAYFSAQPCMQSRTVNRMSVPPLVSNACTTCHGEAGISERSRVPNIAGQHHDYLRDQLIAFKLSGLEIQTGSKNITRNKGMALRVADLRIVEIEELAIYFAALPCR